MSGARGVVPVNSINLRTPPEGLDPATTAALVALNSHSAINTSGDAYVLELRAVKAGLANPYVTAQGRAALEQALDIMVGGAVGAGAAASVGASGLVGAGVRAALPPERAAVHAELVKRGVPAFAGSYPPELAVPAGLPVLRLPFAPGQQVLCQQGNNTMVDATSHSPYQLRYALDFATVDAAAGDAKEGLALMAPAAGVAYVYDQGRVNAPDNWGFGKMVIIDHGNGYGSLLAHLSSTQVQTGQRVEVGQVVGELGTTGSAGNAHLHFQVVELTRKPDPAREQHQAEFGEPSNIEPPFGQTVPFVMQVVVGGKTVELRSTEFRGAEAGALWSYGAHYVAPRTPTGATYASDEVLGRLLAAAGSPYDAGAVRELVQGVVAAPRGHDASAWMALVAERPSPELVGQLEALRRVLAREQRDGLGVAPAPRGRLDSLRAELAAAGLDGFIVPRTDEHHNEYVSRRAERLEWLTGFAGSAGAAVVLPGKAAIFVDGRYTLQAREQVDSAAFAPQHLETTPPAEWVATHAAAGQRIGYDPWLHSASEVAELEAACKRAGAVLVPVSGNPIDAVWRGQPAAPLSPVVVQPLELAGKSSAEKRRELGAAIAAKGAAALVLSQPDSICWLLNVRGGDLPCTPFALSFAVARADGSVELFVDPRKLTAEVRAALGPEVTIRPYSELAAGLSALGKAKAQVLVDPQSAPAAISSILTASGAAVVAAPNPCALPKAIKNEAELAGARAAHLRDGVAVTRFLAWLSRRAPKGGLSELAAAAKLGRLRARAAELRGESFETISGAGPNGAIVHYRATAKTNRELELGSVFLVDSGGQYVDGTTDVTRTVAVGTPPAEAKERFTRVLRGHIALASARFPKGTVGMQLDTLARFALWEAGLDYDHGTGHGVGSFLSVHEGPQRISKAGRVPLEPGMILSNEPGYYKAGEYGIRIENLMAVREHSAPGGERAMLEFETLTLAPIDRNMIDLAQLSARERAWIDQYHARVRAALVPLLDARDRAWLEQATAPLEGQPLRARIPRGSDLPES